MENDENKNKNKNKNKGKKIIPLIFQAMVSSFVIIIMLVTIAYLITISINTMIYLLNNEIMDSKDFIVKIFYAFIMLEIIFMGIKYFEENYHIPIRYFLYIGATTLTKDIFIYPENALIYTGAILMLIISLFIYKKIEKGLKGAYIGSFLLSKKQKLALGIYLCINILYLMFI